MKKMTHLLEQQNLQLVFKPNISVQLFIQHFHCYPNTIDMEDVIINIEQLNQWLETQTLLTPIFSQIEASSANEIKLKRMVFENEMSLYFSHRGDVALFYSKKQVKMAHRIKEEILQFKEKKRKGKNQVYILGSARGSYHIRKYNLKEPEFCITQNYNNDFQGIDQVIQQRLNTQNDKGIVLLHGKPGTGKTNYIKHLIYNVDKKFIFLPTQFSNVLTSPDFMELLLNHRNSVLIIEDAENVITNRTANQQSAVSNLLNITDGILSDCLNIQIICTFNTDISKVDDALLRKGRLIAKYEFNELEKQKAQELSNQLGFTTTITQPMCLADIYNQNEEHFTKQRTAIGF